MTVIPMHMKRGIVLRFQSESPLDVCDCGNEPKFVQYYIKGSANHLNWFVKCETCRKRTRTRNKPQKAIDEWNEFGGTLYDDGRKPMEDQTELNPCGECTQDGLDDVVIATVTNENEESHFAVCLYCGRRTPLYSSKETAIKNWNGGICDGRLPF